MQFLPLWKRDYVAPPLQKESAVPSFAKETTQFPFGEEAAQFPPLQKGGRGDLPLYPFLYHPEDYRHHRIHLGQHLPVIKPQHL